MFKLNNVVSRTGCALIQEDKEFKLIFNFRPTQKEIQDIKDYISDDYKLMNTHYLPGQVILTAVRRKKQ